MTLFQHKINHFQIFIGLIALFFGSLVYIVDRPPEQTYFISNWMLTASLYKVVPNLFGILGDSLPDCAHAFAFIMITAGLTSFQTKGCILISIVWFFTDSLFEIGQQFSSTATTLVPEWFNGIPFLKNTPAFFQTGTFDWFDLAAILIGSVSAYFMLQLTMHEKKILL
jgi:hypothetical protein